MQHHSRAIALVAISLLAPSTAAAQAQRETWNVDSARGPSKLLEFTASEGTWIGLDVSPDGRTIVFDLLGHLYEMPIAGGRATPLTRGRSFNHLPRYSPDGTRILFTSDRTGNEELWLLHRGRDSLERVTQLGYRAFAGTWAPDGRHAYVTTMDLGARFQGHRIDFYGSKNELVSNNVFGAPTHFTENTRTGKVYFGQPSGPLYQSGFQIKTYDLATGEIATYLSRPGGAADPMLSPDGRYLAYVHRDDRQTQLVLHDLATEAERVLIGNLDRDRMESGAGVGFGVYPNFAWHPNGQEIFFFRGGKIHAVRIAAGATREIPFEAPVRRELAERIHFPVTLPDTRARTRSHRWGQRTDQGVLHVALGDLYLNEGEALTNLTRSPALETSPVYDPATRAVYYAAWTDDSLGGVWSLALGPNRRPVKLTSRPGQYGALTLSRDGKSLAYLKGAGSLNRGGALEDQDEFTLVVLGPDRKEQDVTQVKWKTDPGFGIRLVPSITFAPDGRELYYNEVIQDTLYLKRIRLDGIDRRTLVAFPHAAQAVLSPDLRWIAFREYFRTFVTPFPFAGKPVTITAYDKMGTTFRVDNEDGEDVHWTADSKTLAWSRGTSFMEKALAEVLNKKTSGASKLDLSFEYDVARPAGVVALTNARVITMDGERRVLDRATIVVRQDKIEAVGPSVPVPAGARVFDLAGKTVMPGIIDAHGHYNPRNSVLGVVEQDHVGLVANLAYGTTTVYEVYGNHLKDFLVSDLERAGLIGGARLLSTGPPIYGLRRYRPRTFRPIGSQADADEVVAFNKAFGATALKDYVQFTRSARQQMYDAARRMGVNVVAETAVDFQMNWTMLIDGVGGLEHTVGLTPIYSDVHRLWAAAGAGNTPTLIVSYNGPAGETAFHQAERLWEDPKLLRFFPKDDLMRLRRPTHFFEDDIYAVEMAKEIHRLSKAGVSIQVSGHGQMHGLDKHWEMELLSRGGFTPIEVLGTATINSARYLGLDRQLGSIEAGKLADLVILNANPLEDIRNARQIDRVMRNGVLYRGEDASRLHPDPEPARKPYAVRAATTGRGSGARR